MTMKQYCFLIVQICAALFFSSCGEYIDLDHLRPDPKIVINSFPETGVPVTAKLSRTWFYLDGEPNVTAIEFEVNLYVNGSWRESLRPDPDKSSSKQKIYTGTYLPTAGDQLRITASAKGFKDAEGTTAIPEAPLLKDFNKTVTYDTLVTEYDTIYTQHSPVFTFTFKDNHADRENYYLFRIDNQYIGAEEENDNWVPMVLDFMPEPVFSSQVSAFDKIMGYDWLEASERPFSDELFRGQTYTMTMKPTNGSSRKKNRIRFSHISPEYYHYRYTLMLRENNFNADLINAGMGEPIRVFSNIKGGVGIVAGCNTTIMTTEQ